MRREILTPFSAIHRNGPAELGRATDQPSLAHAGDVELRRLSHGGGLINLSGFLRYRYQVEE